MANNHQRRLYWVPIIHTQADLGSLSETVRQLHLRAFGQGQWDRRLQTVEALWQHIRKEIMALQLDYSKVRLYQDGLPCCSKEEAIVRDLAQAGSLNHQLLLELMAAGARLMGTEAADLLLEEYQLARQILAAAGKTSGPSLQKLGQRLLERRDQFIAKQIEQTLASGETGLIFLGMLHNLQGRLPADVALLFLSQARPGESE